MDSKQISNIKRKEKLYRVKVDHRLYLEIPPTGNKRWRVRYTFRGVDTFLSLGIFPEVGVEEALARSEEVGSFIKQGLAPCKWRELQNAKERARINERAARLDADIRSLVSNANVKVNVHEDGMVEIMKGRSMVRLTFEEAVSAKSLLENVTMGTYVSRRVA
jgi:hypothetical protein